MSLGNGYHVQGAQRRELASSFTSPTTGLRQAVLTQYITSLKGTPQ